MPAPIIILLLLLLAPPTTASTTTTTTTTTTSALYFSPTTLFINHQKMLSTFKIFIYPNHHHHLHNFSSSPSLSLFYTSLLHSPFLTHHPDNAHLFFFPFSPQSTRSLARVIRTLRSSFPFWDRSLGADHFFLSSHGVSPTSDRNTVELRKNAVQISCFGATNGNFVPHKDIALPPLTHAPSRAPFKRVHPTLLGYWRLSRVESAVDLNRLIDGLIDDDEFLIESKPLNESGYTRSKYCLMVYDGESEVEGLGVALVHGCVPVLITDRPIQDLPLMDLIRWSEIALVVGSRAEPEDIKRLLKRTWEEGKYERMRRLCVAAAHHFVWNEKPQPLDAFHMVMHQLWVRRHAIRYSKWEDNVAVSTA